MLSTQGYAAMTAKAPLQSFTLPDCSGDLILSLIPFQPRTTITTT